MTTILDYQLIINSAGIIIATALPIGIIFGFAEKMINLFMSLAFGEKKVRI